MVQGTPHFLLDVLNVINSGGRLPPFLLYGRIFPLNSKGEKDGE